jgi:lysophospholipase L1-like esterase
LNSSFTNLLSIVQRANTENTETLSQVAALVQKDQDDMEAKWKALLPMLAAMTNPPPRQVAAPRYVPAQPQVSSYATKDGVPIGVYNQIAAEAARRYPTDYDMQVFLIKEQTEAYRKLHQ